MKKSFLIAELNKLCEAKTGSSLRFFINLGVRLHDQGLDVVQVLNQVEQAIDDFRLNPVRLE